jgi:hypothetical protein
MFGKLNWIDNILFILRVNVLFAIKEDPRQVYKQNLLTKTSESSLKYECWVKEHLPITNTAGAVPSAYFHLVAT